MVRCTNCLIETHSTEGIINFSVGLLNILELVARFAFSGVRDCSNNPKPTEKLVGQHNDRGLPSRNYNRGKNGSEKDKRKTKSDVIGLDDERGLQQVEVERWIAWRMASFDV